MGFGLFIRFLQGVLMCLKNNFSIRWDLHLKSQELLHAGSIEYFDFTLSDMPKKENICVL